VVSATLVLPLIAGNVPAGCVDAFARQPQASSEAKNTTTGAISFSGWPKRLPSGVSASSILPLSSNETNAIQPFGLSWPGATMLTRIFRGLSSFLAPATKTGFWLAIELILNDAAALRGEEFQRLLGGLNRSQYVGIVLPVEFFHCYIHYRFKFKDTGAIHEDAGRSKHLIRFLKKELDWRLATLDLSP
jgi:hypothetical protein